MGRREEGTLPYDMPTPREPMVSRCHVERGNKVHEVCFVSLCIRVDGRMRAPFWLDPAPDSLSALASRRAILRGRKGVDFPFAV